MKSKKINRSRKVTFSFNPAEYDKVYKAFRSTTKRTLSEYLRAVLLQKPVTFYTRDQSLDELVSELIRIRTVLSTFGSSITEAVKKPNTMNDVETVNQWVLLNEKHKQEFFEKMEQINQNIAKISDKWLQE